MDERKKNLVGHNKWVEQFYATETYFTHFLEATQFSKAPVLAERKVNFTLCPAKRPVLALAPLVGMREV